MAINTTIGSGTTLDFKIPLGVPVASIHNVIAEFFTDPNKTVKFSYIETDGFLKLNESTDPNELVGKTPIIRNFQNAGLSFNAFASYCRRNSRNRRHRAFSSDTHKNNFYLTFEP